MESELATRDANLELKKYKERLKEEDRLNDIKIAGIFCDKNQEASLYNMHCSHFCLVHLVQEMQDKKKVTTPLMWPLRC